MKAVGVFIVFLLFFVFLFCSSQVVNATISFSISNPVVNADDIIDVDASISGLISSSCSTTGCYLQAEFRTLDESKNYFGYTYNNSGEFVDYFSSPSPTDEIKSKLFNFVPTSGAWSGKLEAKNNFNDSNYLGPGQYTLRLRRFSGNSMNPISPTTGDSNAVTINLALATPTPTPTPTPTTTVTNTSTPTPTKTPTSAATIAPTFIPVTVSVASETANILGESTDDASLNFDASETPKVSEDPVKNNSVKVLGIEANNLSKVMIGTGLILMISCGILTFLKWKKYL